MPSLNLGPKAKESLEAMGWITASAAILAAVEYVGGFRKGLPYVGGFWIVYVTAHAINLWKNLAAQKHA